MKKKILSFMLAMLMLIATFPLSVFASEASDSATEAAPTVSVSSLYSYDEGVATQFRALPDMEGNFYLDISLDKAPKGGADVVVYYRTLDDSAVAKWGDYESVEADAFVTLTKANGYKARVTVASRMLDDGFYTSDEKGEKNKDKLITRRFLFELTSVEGDAELSKEQSRLYCYLRSNLYHYQDSNAQLDFSRWKSELEVLYWELTMVAFERKYGHHPGVPEWESALKEEMRLYTESWRTLSKGMNSNTLYYTIDDASALNTPPIKYKGTHKDSINLKFDEEWQGFVQSGWCDLGIAITGDLISEYWDSDGPATFHLYYNHGGEKKRALTLYLEGEFDDSTFFGWEHAYEYAIEGKEGLARDDHIDDNFIGFTVYDNDGKVAYEVKKKDGSVTDVCAQLKRTIINGNTVELLSAFRGDFSLLGLEAATAYYLRLPSNFAFADSYSYELISESDDEDEVRYLENVRLAFALVSNKQPSIAKDAKGTQMVTTNLDTIKEGDPLRMSIRFDRPVHIADPNGNCYVTADIYNDKGSLLAKGVKLTLKQLADADYHYAWDTLVFEGAMQNELKDTKIASLRNIRIVDGTEDQSNPTTEGIKSFLTELKILSKTIKDIYIDKDFRTPVATVGTKITADWTKSKSLDLYVNAEGGGRFNDYVTVYYQWSNSTEKPDSYSSQVVFHTNADGESLKTIIGTGNGEMYLHLKAVSFYGKTSESEPIGPFKFDNAAPQLSSDDVKPGGSLKEPTVTIPFSDDGGGIGLRDISLYYVKKNGEEVHLETFTEEDFGGEPKELTRMIPHTEVGVGVGADGNLVFARETLSFYWVLTDKLGNSSGKTAEFELVFDTHDYLAGEIESVGPYDISDGDGSASFEASTQKLIDLTYIYDYKLNEGKNFTPYVTLPDQNVYYAFSFAIKDGIFTKTDADGEVITKDAGIYGVNISYKGKPLDSASYTLVEDGEGSGVYVALIFEEIQSGRYDIQLTRREGESLRVSQVYSLYATEGEEDDTAIKSKVEFGTLLSNIVYQLSSEYPYFYYKDEEGAIEKVYYNDTKQPASFSTLEKAKEYVYYKELGDIYLVKLTAATASALNSGTAGFLIAKGETIVPQAEQYWIRYKSESWTPTSGESAWVYYYYGMSPELTEGALSANLQAALNAVANRITGYGKTVVLTDASLFLGTAMGDKMLDEYGMPYLAPGQIHVTDELSKQTLCGNVWSTEVAFAADKNIYKSTVSVGVEEANYPIIGNFALDGESILQYMTYDQYKSGSSNWGTLNVKQGDTLIKMLNASGVYFIREISEDGIGVFAIYVDKEAPKVAFSQTDEKGELKEIPVDSAEILDIRTKDLYIGRIAATEYDRLSYVAVYRVSNLSFVGVYTAEELASSTVKLDDGNYYIVVADRSGNHYTVTAKVSSTDLFCNIKESPDKFITLTCNRRSDQILRYEVHLNGELVTSTYAEEQTFDKAGYYTVYIQDIYGNEFSGTHQFVRKYPSVTWKYYGEDGKYHTYDPENTSFDGFILTQVYDNQYKISTSIKTRFSFSGDYGFEFIGEAPEYSTSVGAETVVTIEEGQSFTLKVYYKNHKDCYTVYSGAVDVTPPSISVSAEVDVLRNGEYSFFDVWAAKGKVGDVIVMNDLYYELSEIARRTVSNGDTVSSDVIQIDANDANGLSVLELYLDGNLIEKQDTKSGFSQISVGKWGEYRIVAKDSLGNVSEMTFTNGMPKDFAYFVDGEEKERDLHGYLNFETVDGKHVYRKLDYGNTNFKLDLKQSAEVFLSVGVSGGATDIYGFKIADGQIHPLSYKIVLDEKGNKAVDLDIGKVILDMNAKDFKTGQEYLISKSGAHAVYALIGTDKTVSIKVYASEDPSKVVTVGARVEAGASDVSFVSAELSKKSSNVSLKELGIQTNDDIRLNGGFIIDESQFESERIVNVSLYYSKRNDLDVSKLAGKTNVYTTDRKYEDEGFYLLIVRNHYGNERVYRITISRSFGITSSVTFADGYRIFYSKDYAEKLYSNGEVVLDVLDEGVTSAVTLNGVAYTGFAQKKEGNITYLIFSAEGAYEVKLTDAYGSIITRQFEIKKSAYTVPEELLTGYNEKALKRDEGYTNQKLSISKTVYESAGIYYLAIQYGETQNVLFDAFAESPVTTDEKNLVDAIGQNGDGVYTVICRNRYGAVVLKEIHYRETPTLKLERTIRSKVDPEAYGLDRALSIGFWSNNTLTFSTDAKTYEFTVNKSATECPQTLTFENAGDLGNFEYVITYIDEYGFEYSFTAYLVRRNISVDIPTEIDGVEIDGVLNTKNDVFVTFGENIYATYSRNNGEEVAYNSGDVLKMDGTYRFIVTDYAGNVTAVTVKKDTAVEFSFVDTVSGQVIQNGSVVNSSKIDFEILNKDSAYIEKAIRNGVVQADFSGSKFTEDGKWELVICDKLGNKASFYFYVITHAQNGFAYTTPYEYRITELWYDSGDGVKVSYMGFVNHTETSSSFDFKENGKYSVIMTSSVSGVTSAFEFTVNTNAPDVSLVGCGNGETTINDVSLTGYKIGDRIKIYRETEQGEELVAEIEISSLATKVPTISEGGKYRIVVESEAGVQTELFFVRKHVMNTAGSVFIMVMIGLCVIGLFTGLVYRNKSKTDD